MNRVNNIMRSVFLLSLSSLLLSAPIAIAAAAPVNLTPNYGEYREDHEDLSVKVQGGHVKVIRSWSGRQWQLNQHWNALEFVTRNNMLYGLSRNDYVYKQVDATTYVDERDANNRISKTASGYRWSNRSGDFIDYDNALRMTGYGDRNNNAVTLSYNVDGRLSGVAGPDAVQELWFDYVLDGSNNVTSLEVRDTLVVDATTRKVTYSYNATGQLTQVTDVRGFNWGYTYTGTAPGALIATTVDPELRATTITYAGATVASITDATGITRRSKYEYDKTRRQYYRQEKTAGGLVTEVWFDDKGRIIRRDVNGVNESSVAIDTATNTRTTTDALGHKTIRKYDQWDNVTKVTYADGSISRTSYRAAANLITS